EARPDEPLRLAGELLSETLEAHVALRGEARLVPRLIPWSPGEEDGDSSPAAASPRGEPPRAGADNFRLEMETAAGLDRLEARAVARRAPGPGEVEVRVRAAGLNFLDVLLALGVIPDDVRGPNGESLGLGAECAGEVVAVGEGVDDLAIGDR